MKSETVILYEGFYDRAFWAGWLRRLGCSDPGIQPGKASRTLVFDPWNSKVVAGNFGFLTPSGEFIQIQPCHGKANINKAARWRLGERRVKPLKAMILCVDTDFAADAPSDETEFSLAQSIESLLSSIDPQFTRHSGTAYGIDEGNCRICTIPWHVHLDEPRLGIPGQQTLERLACAAIVRAYPDRGQPVHNWLASIPVVGLEDPKRFAWSHMAGWYAGFGCDRFYTNLWEDAAISDQLEVLLKAAGYWQIIEEIVG